MTNTENMKSIEGKDVFRDEFFMTPNRWVTLIYDAFVRYGLKVNLYGDNEQCDPVEEGSQISYEYTKSPAILDMCPETIEKKYIEKSARYDKKTFKMLTKFRKNGRITESFDQHTDIRVNICYLNSTRIAINQMCADAFTKGKGHVTVRFLYAGRPETYKVCDEMPVICTDNMKDRKMYNSQHYTIKKITTEGVTIAENNEKFEMDEFRKCFNLAFCVTVYKYQSDDIDTVHYNIFDADRMNKKEMYTALSRTTKFEYIHVQGLKKVYRYYRRNKHETIPIGHSEYQNGNIYRIDFEDEHIYIGSTTKKLEKRLDEHLNEYKSIVYKHRNKNPRISLVSNCPSKNKYKLEKIETRYINKFSKVHGAK